MVKETRHIFDVNDIKALRFQCHKCHAALVVNVLDAAIPLICPTAHCGERWVRADSTSSQAAGVVEALRKLLGFPDERMTLRFEIDGSDE